jgi:hypothetical protein
VDVVSIFKALKTAYDNYQALIGALEDATESMLRDVGDVHVKAAKVNMAQAKGEEDPTDQYSHAADNFKNAYEFFMASVGSGFLHELARGTFPTASRALKRDATAYARAAVTASMAACAYRLYGRTRLARMHVDKATSAFEKYAAADASYHYSTRTLPPVGMEMPYIPDISDVERRHDRERAELLGLAAKAGRAEAGDLTT